MLESSQHQSSVGPFGGRPSHSSLSLPSSCWATSLSLISFASWERSAPQISCKWAHSSLVEAWCILVVCCSAVDAGILHRYVRLDLRRPEPRQSCLSSSLTGTKSVPLNPHFSSGNNLVVCVGFQMDGAGNGSFLLGSWGICGCAPGSLNTLLVATSTPACSIRSWWLV